MIFLHLVGKLQHALPVCGAGCVAIVALNGGCKSERSPPVILQQSLSRPKHDAADHYTIPATGYRPATKIPGAAMLAGIAYFHPRVTAVR